MKKTIAMAWVCGSLALAGCAGAPSSPPPRVMSVAPISCPNNAPGDPVQCNVVVTMSMPTSTSCTGNVTSEITFSGTTSVPRNIPIVWTLSPTQSGNTTFQFSSPGITINSNPQSQLSQPQGGNNSTSAYKLINAQSQVSTMTYSVNATAKSGGVTPLPCTIADPKIVNSN